MADIKQEDTVKDGAGSLTNESVGSQAATEEIWDEARLEAGLARLQDMYRQVSYPSRLCVRPTDNSTGSRAPIDHSKSRGSLNCATNITCVVCIILFAIMTNLTLSYS